MSSFVLHHVTYNGTWFKMALSNCSINYGTTSFLYEVCFFSMCSHWETFISFKTRRIWGVIRIRISKKNRQHNGQKKEYKTEDKQRFTKHTHKTKDWVTWTPLKTGGDLRSPGRVGSSCSTSGTSCVNLVTNPVINHEWGKDGEVFTTSRTYPWSFGTLTLEYLLYVHKRLFKEILYCYMFNAMKE